MYGRVMSIPDALIWSWFELLTSRALEEIASRRLQVEAGQENPRDAKADLARSIVADFHGAEAAERAAEDFRRAFARGEVPEELETRELPAGDGGPAARTLVALGLSASMREARRKIAEGALQRYEDGSSEGKAVRDPEEKLAGAPAVLRLGRRFIRVVWK
jgi:tyrosyl-tRNA synthetase